MKRFFVRSYLRILGAHRLFWGMCPLCGSDPPRRLCPVCEGSRHYGTVSDWSDINRALWRARFKDVINHPEL